MVPKPPIGSSWQHVSCPPSLDVPIYHPASSCFLHANIKAITEMEKRLSALSSPRSLVSCTPSCPPRLSAPQGLQTPSPFHSCTIYWLILLFLWPPDYHTWSWWVEFIDTITARFSSLHCLEACLHLSPNPSYHFWPSSHYFIFFHIKSNKPLVSLHLSYWLQLFYCDSKWVPDGGKKSPG